MVTHEEKLVVLCALHFESSTAAAATDPDYWTELIDEFTRGHRKIRMLAW